MCNSGSTESIPKIPPHPPPGTNKFSDTSSSSPVVLPTPSVTSEPEHISLESESKMESTQDQVEAQKAEATPEPQCAPVAQPPPPPASTTDETPKDKELDYEKDKKVKKPTKKGKVKKKIDDSSASDDSDADSESEDSTDDEKEKRRKKRKAAAKKAAAKKKAAKEKAQRKKSKKNKKVDSSDESSSESSEASSDSETTSSFDSDSGDAKKSRRNKAAKTKAKARKKNKKVNGSSDDSDSMSSSSSSSSSDSDSDSDDVKHKRRSSKAKRKTKTKKPVEDDGAISDGPITITTTDGSAPPLPGDDINTQVTKVAAVLRNLKMQQLAAAAAAGVAPPIPPKAPAKKNAHEFKRVDQVWDTKLRDYKLVESTADQKDEFECVFTVRRRFNWEGKLRETLVDIKSKALRGVLQVVLKECKCVSLVEDIPEIDPHILYHYYNEIKTYMKKTLKPKLKRAKKSKDRKQLAQEIAQCKLLLGYIDEDYAATRKALKPLLKAGTITYELCWALFKPNTIVYTPTYGNKEDPRCFRVEQCFEYESWLSGAKSCCIDGKYLEYDGQVFGLGDHQAEIKSFKGHKKITSLPAYPLRYHKDPKGIRKLLIERGKKFIALQGMNYRLQKGIAYQKVKNTIAKYNISGRVMVDPAIFRRIQPNYPLSFIKPEELNREDEEAEQEMSDDCCGESDDDGELSESEKPEKDPMRVVMWKDSKGKKHPIAVSQSTIDAENGVGSNETTKLEMDEDGNMANHIFTEEELIIASPVVLGFAFSEKLWLEFSLSGIEEIQWNAEAFNSLVLPDKIKSNLKGLVSSHRFNAARTIDDVIQGKGKGLNVVLHGPPGVGKTLTGESIAEYLKCPLYAVSAGELGTNSGSLERDLNRIMDITHSWGAILLLDEADVFLEARQPHDIHRNSLVSVFLRLTEYYQGILFLTTNRVETFDEAFQSRIHMGIRYENLKPAARKKIWQHHVGKVEKMAVEEQDGDKRQEKMKPFTDEDFNELSKRNMNGRQIKNTVKTGQSIALSEKTPFSMEHLKRVLEVAQSFEDDMRGGKGYRDAMQHYT
ncbi:AAA family ATPase [Stagonosporopsis vannaccii]|nr:AAA family ATPase [Stagonosporopsis vannaccii]